MSNNIMSQQDCNFGVVTIPACEVSIIDESDVIIVGGGPAGVMAAVSATRMGVSVVLIERNGFLGGAMTMHLPIQGLVDRNGKIIIKGVVSEFIELLRLQGGAYHKLTLSPQTNNTLIIDPEIVKIVCQEMVLDAGVKLHYHTMLSDVRVDENGINTIIVQNKSGRQAIKGRFFIDASGDADLADLLHVPIQVGREKDGLPQSVTLTFRVDGVDEDSMRRAILANPELYNLYEPAYAALRDDRKHCLVGCSNLVEQAQKEGFPIPFGKVVTCSLMPEGAVLVNMVHIENVRCHEASDLSYAEIQSRKQIPVMLKFLQRYMPGFERAVLTTSSHEVGVRETRRISGEYTLQLEELREGIKPFDTIALSGYPVDIHSPDGKTVELEHVPVYGIPFRCLIPKGVDNLLVAGRSLSASHEALASVRVMAPCMAMGQAVGIAAALSIRDGCINRDIDITELQKILKQQGALI
jgi:FAD-dependent oxidoreductase family protein